MNKILYFLLCLTIASCINKPVSYEETKNKAYSEGYEHGVKDKMKSEYVNPDKYSRLYVAIDEEDAKCYRENFRLGYNQGFLNGSKTVTQDHTEHDESSIEEDDEETYHVTITHTSSYSVTPPSNDSDESDDTDYHDWEKDEVEGIYVKLNDCETDEEAEYISENNYLGKYIMVGSNYYAKTRKNSDTYEIEIGTHVGGKLYRIEYSNEYILFKWQPNASSYDEGILEIYNNHGTFYIEP